MTEICEEMKKLRTMLDEKGIEWKDDSQEFPLAKGDTPLCIHRTHFNYKGEAVSVINGWGTYGGFDYITEENQGLLEVMVGWNDPIGCLTAEEVMKEVFG